jgi:hypothetical protein
MQKQKTEAAVSFIFWHDDERMCTTISDKQNRQNTVYGFIYILVSDTESRGIIHRRV